jgi:hypothetical protein
VGQIEGEKGFWFAGNRVPPLKREFDFKFASNRVPA